LALGAALDTGCFVEGRALNAFEQAFAVHCHRKHCVGVGNGTDALYLALKALNIGPGHEVITTAYSFVATAQAITRTGANVRFVDIERATCNLNADLIEALIGRRTRAILPVHLFGQPVDMPRILRLARLHGLHIVEDAAQAHGARIRGWPVGSAGKVACFSFYPTKNLGALGDGGAVVTNSADLATRIRNLSRHARVSHSNYDNDGINSRLDALQAAVLNLKLHRLPAWTERRRRIAERYRQQMSGFPLGLPPVSPDLQPAYHVYPIRVPAEKRDALQKFLRASGIESRVYYPRPLPRLKGFAQYTLNGQRFPEANRASREILCLPISPELCNGAVDYVIARIRAFLAAERLLYGAA
jgi:dTDP-4-amino-4,6-dideoxygalactose transaminase